MQHPDLNHPRRHRRAFAHFAMWFADWQGTPMFVAILTCLWISELAWNQFIAPALGLAQFRFDPSTWLLNLALSLLAAYAASLSVMGAKVQFAELMGFVRKLMAMIQRVLDGVGGVRSDIQGLRSEIHGYRDEVRALRAEMRAKP